MLANANQVSLSLQVAPGAFVTGDADSLRQLVSILMENAIKYAGPGGKVVVHLDKQGKSLCFWVEKYLHGASHRKLESPVRPLLPGRYLLPRETGGYGIGLSIAKSICLAHHAKISAEAVEPKSIRFTVSFS